MREADWEGRLSCKGERGNRKKGERDNGLQGGIDFLPLQIVRSALRPRNTHTKKR